MLEIAQPAMDELGRSRGCGTGEIGLLEEDDPQAPAGSITRNAAAIHPAADHREIVGRVGRLFLPLASATRLVFDFCSCEEKRVRLASQPTLYENKRNANENSPCQSSGSSSCPS